MHGSRADQQAAHALGARSFDQHVHDLLGRGGHGVELPEVERKAQNARIHQMLGIDRVRRQACEQAQNVGPEVGQKLAGVRLRQARRQAQDLEDQAAPRDVGEMPALAQEPSPGNAPRPRSRSGPGRSAGRGGRVTAGSRQDRGCFLHGPAVDLRIEDAVQAGRAQGRDGPGAAFAAARHRAPDGRSRSGPCGAGWSGRNHASSRGTLSRNKRSS